MNIHNDNVDPVGASTLSIISKANAFNRWMYQQIKPWLKGHVLEVGSGMGNISTFVLQDKYSTILSDINANYTQLLAARFRGEKNLLDILAIDLQHPDFENHYKELSEKFDSVFLLNVIEHLADDAAAVKNCKHLLTAGGHLIILAPAYQYLYCNLDRNLGHYRRYLTRTLHSLFTKNEMIVVKKKYFNLAGLSGWFLWGKVSGRQFLDAGSFGAFNKLVPVFRLFDKIILHKAGLSAIVVGKKV